MATSMSSSPCSKKCCLNLKLKKQDHVSDENDANVLNERFAVIDDSSLKGLAKPYAPKNTKLNTQ